MPARPAAIRRTLTLRRERKDLLILACAVDRHGWRQAGFAAIVRPRPQWLGELSGGLEDFTRLLPGRFGRWLRGAGILTHLVRALVRLLR